MSLRRHAAAYNAAVFACVAALAAATVAALAHPWFYVSVAVLAAISMEVAEPFRARLLLPLGHALYAGIATAFVAVIAAVLAHPAFDKYAIAFALAAAIASFTALRLHRREEKISYFVGIYIVVHVLLASELAAVANARWLASAAYAVTGSGLLVTGLALKQVVLQRAGMISLALLVMRLFLYDMSKVDIAVRIVLFLVMGFAFLGLSYMVRARRFAD
jgi:hypothetical protein